MLPVVNQGRMTKDRNDSGKYFIFYFKNTSIYMIWSSDLGGRLFRLCQTVDWGPALMLFLEEEFLLVFLGFSS